MSYDKELTIDNINGKCSEEWIIDDVNDEGTKNFWRQYDEIYFKNFMQRKKEREEFLKDGDK